MTSFQDALLAPLTDIIFGVVLTGGISNIFLDGGSSCGHPTSTVILVGESNTFPDPSQRYTNGPLSFVAPHFRLHLRRHPCAEEQKTTIYGAPIYGHQRIYKHLNVIYDARLQIRRHFGAFLSGGTSGSLQRPLEESVASMTPRGVISDYGISFVRKHERSSNVIYDVLGAFVYAPRVPWSVTWL